MNSTIIPQTAAARGIAVCHVCRKLGPATSGWCSRCGAAVHLRKYRSLERTRALNISAAMLYFPANLLPVMTVEGIGGPEVKTILGGVATFWDMHAYLPAIIVFVASVVVPILKIISIGWLCVAVRRRFSPLPATRVYRITEFVGRWSMVDVFVVAILVAVIQFGAFMTVTPGPAALSFAGVVIFSMLAAMAFDPRLLWDAPGPRRDSGQST